MTGSVTFSTAIGGDGSTVTDDDNATTGLRDGGWRTRFVPCFTNQVSIANYVVTKAGEAAASQTAAGSSATAAAAAYDSFDDRYLGAKSSNPTVDNDGNALLTGALYWNTVSNEMRVYSGSAWIAAYIPSSGYLELTGGTMTGAITFAAGQFGTNVNTFLSTPSSANLAAALTDETGSGAAVFANTPTLIAPILGTPTSGTLTNCTFPTLNQNTTGTATTATNLASGSAGTIPYQSASGTTAMLAVGTSGQVLTSAGAAAPTWSTPAAATKTISNKTAAYTIVSGDLGSIINCTSGTFTVSLTAAASLGSGFTCTIWNTGTGAITIDPNASETIDGVTTLILQQGEGLAIVCNGTNWETDDKKPMRAYAENFTAAYSRPIASGSESIAMGNGSTASGGASIAYGYSSVASSNNSVAFGINSNSQGSVTATGAGAMALGGSYASGTDSFAAAIANNTSSYGATGSGSSIAMGFQSKATSISTYTGIALGSVAYQNNIYGGIAIGYHPLASGAQATAIGYYAIASGDNSISFGGANSSATGYLSVVLGGYGGVAAQTGKYVFGSFTMSTLGDAQSGKIVLRAATTTTTAVVLTSNAEAASTTNQLIVASGQAMAIQGTLIAKESGSGNMAAYNITGAVSNNGGTMAVTGLALTLIGSDSIGLGASPTIAVDNTNKGVTITSGYKSATNIRWVATLNTSEATYA
jgi:hypothetical protein